MIDEQPDHEAIRTIVELACRAPSIHNSQPWSWRLHGNELRLYADYRYALPSADPLGRQLVISLGAVLDHLQAASTVHGWATDITRLPDPNRRDHLATVEFTGRQRIFGSYQARAVALRQRFTDRLPLLAPNRRELDDLIDDPHLGSYGTQLTLLSSDSTAELARASRASASARRYDAEYQDELSWWTSGSDVRGDGIPERSLLTSAEVERVAVARDFPPATIGQPRRSNISVDQAAVFVLSTYSGSRLDLLRCGEALSGLLLTATAVGLNSCIVSHMIETPTSRAIIGELIDNVGEPQVLVRIGRREESGSPVLTPRRPVSKVFEITPPGTGT